MRDEKERRGREEWTLKEKKRVEKNWKGEMESGGEREREAQAPTTPPTTTPFRNGEACALRFLLLPPSFFLLRIRHARSVHIHRNYRYRRIVYVHDAARDSLRPILPLRVSPTFDSRVYTSSCYSKTYLDEPVSATSFS